MDSITDHDGTGGTGASQSVIRRPVLGCTAFHMQPQAYSSLTEDGGAIMRKRHVLSWFDQGFHPKLHAAVDEKLHRGWRWWES